MENLANDPRTYLASGITNSATSLNVTDASRFPSSGNFHLVIDSEILLVTAVSGTTFTVTRAQESTTAASHSSGANVDGLLTSETLKNFRSDAVTKGTYASRPAAGVNGRLYIPTDSFLWYRDNGSSWDAFGPIYSLTPPVVANFSWANQGSATEVTTNGFPYLSCTTNSGSDNIKIRTKALPTPPFTITYGLLIHQVPGGQAQAGVLWYDSVSTKAHSYGFYTTPSNIGIGSDYWNSPSSFNSTLYTISYVSDGRLYSIINAPIYWYQLIDDNTNRILKFSLDGINFTTIDSRSRTTFMTANRVGYFVNPYNSFVGISVLHYKEA